MTEIILNQMFHSVKSTVPAIKLKIIAQKIIIKKGLKMYCLKNFILFEFKAIA
jgi:hypothetical protein